MNQRVPNRRIRLLLAVFALAFGIALVRAMWLQGVRAASFERLASRQHSQVVAIPAARGTIYDRGGVQLAIGEQAMTVYADPRLIGDAKAEAFAAAPEPVSAAAPRRSAFVPKTYQAAPNNNEPTSSASTTIVMAT